MEHAHEEQYFRKLVGLIIKIIFDLKVFFFSQHHIKERINISMGLVSVTDKFTGVHVYLVTWDGNRILGTYVLFWQPDNFRLVCKHHLDVWIQENAASCVSNYYSKEAYILFQNGGNKKINTFLLFFHIN